MPLASQNIFFIVSYPAGKGNIGKYEVMQMIVFHISRRRGGWLLAGLAAVIVLALLLTGCPRKEEPPALEGTRAAEDADRVAWLNDLGWQVEEVPVATLDLVLPEDLTKDYAAYTALQNAQGLPFIQYAGQAVRRYTYTVTNYPGVTQGVQANLYLCEDEIIGGDIISLGAQGFRTGLMYPESSGQAA